MAQAGSCWVSGQYLYFLASSTAEYRYLGTYEATPAGAKKGSCWLDASGYIHYIDENGDQRYLSFAIDTTGVGSATSRGSLWVETSRLKAIDSSNRKLNYHTDVSFSSSSFSSSHGDTHGDSAHRHWYTAR